MVATSNGDDAKLSELLGRGGNPNSKLNGCPALTMACSNGKLKCAKLLVDAGAEVDALDASGHTALIVACATGTTACVTFLVSANHQTGVMDTPPQEAR